MQPASSQQLPLLEPKFHVPRLPAALVKRERLFQFLDIGLEQKLTLLNAPAGFGKTTLVGQWLDAHRAHHPASALAWMSLESSDNDLVRFWRYVITACQSFGTPPGQLALEQLASVLQPPFAQSSLETVLTTLLNDLSRLPGQGILVLEDYHLITEVSLHQSVAFFLEHLPATLHVILLTRGEPPLPLVRWRARGELCEISAADLRFSRIEIERFFQANAALSLDSLPAGTLDRLEARLEGWAVGLRLFSLALQRCATSQEKERLLALFAGDQRSLQEYFVAEVLNAQPEPMQDFLLRTSILNHPTGSLCDALTGRHDGEQLLEEIEHAGLFLEPLDGSERWYRYHALFAEAMRAEARHRFNSPTLHTLFQQASQWYIQQGMFFEAVEAAFQAEDVARAATLIEQFLQRTNRWIFNPQNYQGPQGFQTFRRWFEQLPEALLRANPILCMGYATAMLFILVVEQQSPYNVTLTTLESLLLLAEQGFRRADDARGIGSVLAFRALITREQGAAKAAVAFAEQALAYLPSDDMEWRGVVLNVIGMGKLLDGELEEARQIFVELGVLGEIQGNRAIQRANAALLNVVVFEQGALHQAAEFFQHMLAEAREESDRDDMAHASLLLAWLDYEWDELTDAERHAEETLKLSLPLANEEFQTHAALVLARIEHVRGSTEAALQRCHALLAHLSSAATPLRRRLARDVQLTQARFQLDNGDVRAAQHWMINRQSPDEEFYLMSRLREDLLVARCHLALGQAEDTLNMLSSLRETAHLRGYRSLVLEMQVLMVLAYSSQGEMRTAYKLLQAVLEDAYSEGYRRLFLDEGEDMLALLRALLPRLRERHLISYVQTLSCSSFSSEQSSSSALAQPVEPLSTQELRVLRLLAAGRSNPLIATELVVSVNTVKVHVQNIYRKLNVNNRVEASEVARLLHLVP